MFLALAKHHEAVFTVHFSPMLAAELRTSLESLENCLLEEGIPTVKKGKNKGDTKSVS